VLDNPHGSPNRLATVLLLVLVAIALFRDVYLLFRHSVAVGIDGYYYVLQIESLHAHRGLFFPTIAPVGLYLLAAMRAWTSNPAMALKLGALASHLSLCLGVYVLLKLLAKSNVYALCGVLIIATSSLHTFLLSEFLSNSIAVSFLIWSAAFALMINCRAGKLAGTAAGFCALLAIFSHRSGVFLLAVFVVSFALFRLMRGSDSKSFRKAIALGVTVVLFFAPQLIQPPWILSLGRLALLEKTMLLVGSVSLLLFIRERESRNRLMYRLSGAIALMSLLVTLNPFLNRETGSLSVAERLSLLAYIQLAILVPSLFWLLKPMLRRWALPACLALSVLFSAISLQIRPPVGLSNGYLSRRAELIDTLRKHQRTLDEVKLVIAPHGDQFVVTDVLGVPSQQKWASNQQDIPYWLLQRFSNIHSRNGDGTIKLDEETLLVRDDRLDELLGSLDISEIRRTLPNNPHLIGRLLTQQRPGVDIMVNNATR
jgi:hypothetical protein